MKKFYRLLIIAICILIAACYPTHRNNGDIISFNDARNSLQQNEAELLLSELAPKIRYVPLEKTEDVMLSHISKIYLAEGYIFVSDQQSVFQFDNTGKFVRQFGRMGRGPGEFIPPIRFTVDSIRGEVIIQSTVTNRVNVYNLRTGEFKFYRDMPFFVSNISSFPNGKRIFFTGEFLSGVQIFTANEVYFTDTDLNLLDSISNPLRANIQSNSFGYVSYFILDDAVYYLYNFRDTLHRITPDFVRTPYAVFDLQNELSRDNLQVLPVEGQVVLPDFLWIPRITGNSNYLFIDFHKGFTDGTTYEPVKLVYNKAKGRPFRTQGFTNDLDGGLPFWPRWVNNKALISFYLPHEIIEYYSKTRGTKTHDESFVQLAENLSEYGNPVLVIVHQE